MTLTDDVLTDARPGRVVLRASRLRAAAQEGLRLEVPGDHLRLPDGVPLVEVLQLPELAGLSAAVLEQTGAWHRRPCQQCLQRIAEHAHQDGDDEAEQEGRDPLAEAAIARGDDGRRGHDPAEAASAHGF